MNPKTTIPLLILPSLILLHLLVSPYTKVEESFHIQAIHDISTYGIPVRGDIPRYLRAHYDHFSFPGSVPRTFVGAVVLAGLSKPVTWLIGGGSGVDGQVLARGILGLLNGLALVSFAVGVRRAFGRVAFAWYLVLQGSQFHVVYYASRTLSNMFAFGFSTLAMRFLLPEPAISTKTYRKRCQLSLFLLTIAGIIFRSELALLLAVQTIYLYTTGRGRITIRHEILPAGLLGLLTGLALTLPIDSYFWQHFQPLPLWPELAAFSFNVLSGHSVAWGTHAWHYYFSNALPRLLLNPLTYLLAIPTSLVAPSTRPSSIHLLTPSLAFVALYSLQPHKEWRFIVYVVPALTASAALGASYIWTRRSKAAVFRLLSWALVGSVFAAFVGSSFFLLPVSAANYPGACAVGRVQEFVSGLPLPLPVHRANQDGNPNRNRVNVHLGNLACQTGVTRFLQQGSGRGRGRDSDSGSGSNWDWEWEYDKTENETVKSSPSFWAGFDYVLVEAGGDEEERVVNASRSGASSPSSSSSSSFDNDDDGDGRNPLEWEVVDVVWGFAGIGVVRPGQVGSGGGGEGGDGGRRIEEDVIQSILGAEGVRAWRGGREFARRFLTRGWWVEGKMEPKIKIMRRVERMN